MRRCVSPRLHQPAREGLQRVIETDSSGGVITSSGGVTLLSRADHRQPELVVHDVETLILQLLCGLARGSQDLNDQGGLRRDPALQAVAGRMTPRRGDCARLAARAF